MCFFSSFCWWWWLLVVGCSQCHPHFSLSLSLMNIFMKQKHHIAKQQQQVEEKLLCLIFCLVAGSFSSYNVVLVLVVDDVVCLFVGFCLLFVCFFIYLFSI